jgi:hypothetical protein
VLEPLPVVTGHAQVSVKVEAVAVGLARARGGDPRRVRLRSETPDARAGGCARPRVDNASARPLSSAITVAPPRPRFRIGIDTGGTFTDVVAVNEATGEVLATKTPSTPDDPSLGEGDDVRADLAATAARRVRLAAERGPAPFFDRGPGYARLAGKDHADVDFVEAPAR